MLLGGYRRTNVNVHASLSYFETINESKT